MAVVTYKCPSCDGGLLFDAASQKFHCEYCGGSFLKEEIEKEPVKEAQPEQANTSAVYYSCPSCGAEIVTDETTASTTCFYCHNPVVLAGKLSGEYMPGKIIPFAINKEEAVKRFLMWTKKKWFIPKYFFAPKQVEKISGVYFPFWLVDSDVEAQVEATGETHRTWRSGNMEHTETSHFRLIREGSIHFEDVIKAALKKSDKKLIESVQPFNSKALEPFSMAYLSGFLAEKRDIEKNELTEEVQNEVRSYAESVMRDTMSGFSSVNTVGKNIEIMKENWDYALLPVWTLTYQKDGKTYYYAMNGQDGKIFGNLPINFGKLFAVAGVIFAALFTAFLIGGWFY